jgi:hypothetical protein
VANAPALLQCPCRINTTSTTASQGVEGKVLELGSVPTAKARPRRKNQYTDPNFDRFWENYPWRKEKLAAYRAWQRYVVDAGVDVEVVIAAAAAYRDDPNRKEDFTKYPQGWLSAGRWEDELKPVKPAAHQIKATDWDAQRAEADARVAAMLAEEA